MKNFGNPFVECTSRDMSFQEIFQYWCDPFHCYSIDQATLFTSMTPIIIEGPRGSGKTMILKYISYFCQKERFNKDNNSKDNFLDMIKKTGSLGIYFRYKDDFGSLFKSLNCSQNSKNRLFLYYYEMYILEEILKVLSDLEQYDINHPDEWNQVKCELCELISFEECHVESFDELSNIVKRKISGVDTWVRKSRYLESAEDELFKIIGRKNQIPSVCRLIVENITVLKGTKFIISIDEYENASDYQCLLNTLLKQVDHTSNLSYRIGSRPQGMKTLKTNIGTEFLQIDRDFLLFVLQSENMTKYRNFLEQIASKRLENITFFKNKKITDIRLILGKKENLDDEARTVVKGRVKHFEVLKKIIPEKEYSKVVNMINVLWILRGISPEDVRDAMKSYQTGEYKEKTHGDLSYKYKLDYSDKYRYQLLFILLGIYGQNKKYYSFNTFAYLSSGAVNDFISLCRNVFYLLDESYYEHSEIKIPINIQAKGAEVTSIEQMDKIKLCNEHGTEMYTFVMNIGNYFKYLHKDIYAKYPETNQFAFEDEGEFENRPILADVRNSLIKWGVIVKKPRIQSISIGRRKGRLYYLNRMFSPIFCISFRTRGGYNFVLSTTLFEKFSKENLEINQILSWKKEERKLSSSKENASNFNSKQMVLFD